MGLRQNIGAVIDLSQNYAMNKQTVTNYQSGHDAEKRVAEWLTKQRFTIIELNWRTRRCEIDIIAAHKKVLYFIEVKARQSTRWGGGIDYITPRKLAQMKRAAEYWLATHQWDYDVRLAVVAVDGDKLQLTEITD